MKRSLLVQESVCPLGCQKCWGYKIPLAMRRLYLYSLFLTHEEKAFMLLICYGVWWHIPISAFLQICLPPPMFRLVFVLFITLNSALNGTYCYFPVLLFSSNSSSFSPVVPIEKKANNLPLCWDYWLWIPAKLLSQQWELGAGGWFLDMPSLRHWGFFMQKDF